MVDRYGHHVLDVLKHHKKDSFDQTCCQDRSGHPTLRGFETIATLLDYAYTTGTIGAHD